MTVEQLIAFNAALFAAIVTPGPAMLLALRTSIAVGRVAGIAVGCGLASAAVLWTLAAILGLEALFALFPWAYGLMKAVGAVYLVYLAYKTWKSATASIEGQPMKAGNAFASGVLVNLFNPKAVLFAGAVLIVVFPSGLTMDQALVVLSNHLAIEIVFYTSVAFALSSASISRPYLAVKAYVDRAAAVVLFALGLRILLPGRPQDVAN